MPKSKPSFLQFDWLSDIDRNISIDDVQIDNEKKGG